MLILSQDDDLIHTVSQIDVLADGGNTMSRKRSSHSQNRPQPFENLCNDVQLTPAVDKWLSADTPFNPFNPTSAPGQTTSTTRRRPASRPIVVTSYDPDDYCKRASTQTLPNFAGGIHAPSTINNLPLSPNRYAGTKCSSSPISDIFTSPIDTQTNPTSVEMSRQTSFAGSSFCNGLQKLGLSSSMSRSASSISQHNSSFSKGMTSAMAREPSTLSTSFDSRQVLSYTGGAADDKKLADAFSRQPPSLAGIDGIDVSTQRPPSTDLGGSATSRLTRKNREQGTSSIRTLAPKGGSSSSPSVPISIQTSGPVSQSMSPAHSSENQNDPIAIPRLPFTRHVPSKVKCEECSEHADGFKGEHELKRHILRAHRPTRKVYVCIDPTPGRKFLSECEHCNDFKRYNAYYNAGAHLRRKHFNKRPQGERRKGKLTKEEKRGGKGGGTEPKMDVLKLYMREFDIYADGTPLDDADMAYSTITSIAASAQQSGEQAIGESDRSATHLAGDSSLEFDDVECASAHAITPTTSLSIGTLSSTHDIPYDRMSHHVGVPSASPETSLFISGYSQPSPLLINHTTQANQQPDDSATIGTNQSSTEPSHGYESPLFDNMSQSFDQFLELNFEDMFTYE